ncbi:hypothetical protein EDB19DRAFT_1840821, partial [Suillus lakei]
NDTIFFAASVAKSKNIPTLLSESLHACHPDLQQVLMGNVVLTGGGSLLPGPADRLETELSRNFPHLLCSIVYRGDLAQVLRGVPGVLAQWPESWLIEPPPPAIEVWPWVSLAVRARSNSLVFFHTDAAQG